MCVSIVRKCAYFVGVCVSLKMQLLSPLHRSRPTPLMVEGLRDKSVVSVVAGGEHSVAVTEEGALYTWGRGSYGRLGHGEMAGEMVGFIWEYSCRLSVYYNLGCVRQCVYVVISASFC